MTVHKTLLILKHKIIKEMKISEFKEWLLYDKYGARQNNINLVDTSCFRAFLITGNYLDHLDHLDHLDVVIDENLKRNK